MGFETSAYHFFANSSTEEKFKEFKKKILTSTLTKKTETITCIEKIYLIRIERNKIGHSLILVNENDPNDFRIYGYKLRKDDGLFKEFGNYNISDLDNLSYMLKEAHNELYSLHYENKSG